MPKHAQKYSKTRTFLQKKPFILQIEMTFSFDESIFPRLIPLITAYFTLFKQFLANDFIKNSAFRTA